MQKNCETANFVAAPDPTGNYAFDINIDTGATKFGNEMSAATEDVLEFGWMGLVAVVHGLLVMFEWCYSLNLLSGALIGQITRGLHQAQISFTTPWMVLALACASVLAVYHGLIRRRVAETLGQVLMMFAMMIGGLWVIANPGGTVGALGRLANAASLGTLNAVATGDPNRGPSGLATSMQNVFSAVISVPWCYMEFGNVRWCHDTSQLDAKLRSAALRIADEEQERSKCSGLCGQSATESDKALAISAHLLKTARTNGELFLSLPANERARNSVKSEDSLLYELCGGGGSANECEGPTAAEAEFRSERGTGPRVIGLILIWVGALGMLLLFGFLAFRLLEAALAALFYLLMAPAAVLAPALGDGGRAAFRGWAMRLLGAVVSKLIYSFLLGVVLMMMDLLLGLESLGWWAQWLLISALWWVVLHHRHKVLGFARGSTGPAHEPRSMRWFYRVRMAQDLGRLAGWARHKFMPPPPSPSGRPTRERVRRPTGSGGSGRAAGGGGSRSGGSSSGGPEPGGPEQGGPGTGGTGSGGTRIDPSTARRPGDQQHIRPADEDDPPDADGPRDEDSDDRRRDHDPAHRSHKDRDGRRADDSVEESADRDHRGRSILPSVDRAKRLPSEGRADTQPRAPQRRKGNIDRTRQPRSTVSAPSRSKVPAGMQGAAAAAHRLAAKETASAKRPVSARPAASSTQRNDQQMQASKDKPAPSRRTGSARTAGHTSVPRSIAEYVARTGSKPAGTTGSGESIEQRRARQGLARRPSRAQSRPPSTVEKRPPRR